MVSAATSLKTIDLRVLGPLSVVINGRGVPLGGPRQMAVLARLMFTPGQVVSMDQLVDSVWDGDEPAQPQVAIRSYISNLRRAIEPNRPRRATDSCIPSSPPGYTLEVDPGCVDLTRFESLISAGRSQLAAGEFAAATVQLRDALSLWRGEPFAGLSDSEIFTAHRSQLVQLRETASEMLFEAQLERGDHLTVVSTIEAAIAENPLRERLTELAMVAFYRSGRQADALELGQRLRSELLDRMGIDPSPEIAELELKILNHDRSLAPAKNSGSGRRGLRDRLTLVPSTGIPPEPETPPVQPTVVEPGIPAGSVRDVTGTSTAELPTPLPVLVEDQPTGPSVVSTTHRSGAIGRTAELEALAAIKTNLFLGRSTTAVVTGEPGIGKTRLVQTLAEDFASLGIPVAWSRSMQSEQQKLWPWAQMIVSLFEGGDASVSDEAWAGLEPLYALGPSVISALGLPLNDRPNPEATFSNAEIFLAVTQLLQRVSQQSPLVLVFEDLQWADHLSVAMLNFAASTLAEWPIGFVVTWRQTDIESGPLATELRNLARVPYLVRVGLEGFDERATTELARQIGRTLSGSEARDLQRRCGGSPLFLTELLADSTRLADAPDGHGAFSHNLTDTVMARVDRLHPRANGVLTIGALFRTPFSLKQIGPLCEVEVSETLAILNEAVRGGVLEEVDGGGWYQFQYPLMAEVLTMNLLVSERASHHGRIGRHLVKVDRKSYETAYHLGKSDVSADHHLAARIALDLFEAEPDLARLPEIDELVEQVLAASKAGPEITPMHSLVADARFYLSWRAWLDGRGDDWRWEANRSFGAVLKLLQHPERPPERNELTETRDAQPEGEDPQTASAWLPERRTRGAMAAIGHPALFVGPLSDPSAEENLEETLSNVNMLLDRLPNDDQAHWLVQVQASYLKYLLSKPGGGSMAKAIRDAKKAIGNARKKVASPDPADALLLLLHRFSDGLSAAEHLEMAAEILKSGAPLRRELLVARFTYPKLLECERHRDAATQTQQIWTRAKTVGNQLEVAEARALRIRHLIWSGRLDEAEEQVERGRADWKQLGLGGAVAFGRQHHHLCRLRNRSVDPEGLLARSIPVNAWTDRVAKQALVLAEIGDNERSKGYLDSAVESLATSQNSHCDLAQIAITAALLGHRRAGEQVLEPLKELGDRLILSTDRFLILGPASLFAGLAARAAGLQSSEHQLFERAMLDIKRKGGSVDATIAMLSRLESPTCVSMNEGLGGLEVDEDVNIENLSNPTPSNS